MAEEKLHGEEVSGIAVNLGGLRPPLLMRAINSSLQADTFDPTVHQPGILPNRYVRARVNPTWEAVLRTGDPERW